MRCCAWTRVIVVLLYLLAAACGGHGLAKHPESPVRPQPKPATKTLEGSQEIEPPAPPPAPAGALPEATPTVGAPVLEADQPTDPAAAEHAVAFEPAASQMLDIEAELRLEVKDLASGASALRALLRRHHATITQDSTTQAGGNQRTELTFRVATKNVYAVIADIEKLGQIRSKNITAMDISKQYFDAELRLKNLERTLARYLALYDAAKDVESMLKVEREVTRVQGEIEQLRGDLRYMKDRAARSTVHVTLWALNTMPEEVIQPQAAFYPGARLGWVVDAGRDQPKAGLASAGLSIRFDYRSSLDVELLKSLDTKASQFEGFWASFGADTYSEFFGNGTRPYLNPYLGFRMGYGRRGSNGEALIGVTGGLEIIKTKLLCLELDVRAYGLFFNKAAGTRLALQPTLGLNFAF